MTDKEIMLAFRHKLKEEFLKKNLIKDDIFTDTLLASIIGYDRGHVSNLMNGNVPLSNTFIKKTNQMLQLKGYKTRIKKND